MKRILARFITGLVVAAVPVARAQAGCWPYPAFLAPAPTYIYPACDVQPVVVWYPAPAAWQPVPAPAKPEQMPAPAKAAQPKAAAPPEPFSSR
jgi:hypothetical protein